MDGGSFKVASWERDWWQCRSSDADTWDGPTPYVLFGYWLRVGMVALWKAIKRAYFAALHLGRRLKKQEAYDCRVQRAS